MNRPLASSAISDGWPVGVCCRAGDDLERCLQGLARSEWGDAVRLFLDAGAVVPRRFAHLPLTCLNAELAWPARDLLILGELLMRQPRAEAYVLVRGDAVVGCPNLRHELQVLFRGHNPPEMLLLDGGNDTGEGDVQRMEARPCKSPLGLVIPGATLKRLLADRQTLVAATAAAAGNLGMGDSVLAWAFERRLTVDCPARRLVRPAGEAEQPRHEDRETHLRVRGCGVSVVVPTWNCGPYLRPCLNSLLRQTVADEIIVVDDASTDDTREILSEFADRVQIVKHTTRRGANAARNTGLEIASGDFIAMADSDNEYGSTWLEALRDAVLTRPDIGVAYCGFTRLAEDTGSVVFTSRDWDIGELWFSNYIDMPSVVRRAALPEGGLVEGFRPFDDWRLWLDMASRGWTGKYVSENLYTKHVRSAGKTRRSKSIPAERAREVALLRRQYAHLAGLEAPIAIVIPAHGCEDLTTNCLAHLADFSGVPFVVYYVDNGSPISTVEAVAAAAEEASIPLRILRNSRNRGFTEAVNQGIDASGTAHVLILNNDCFVGPNCVELLVRELVAGEQVAAVGPLTGDRGGQSLRGRARRDEANVDREILDLLDDPVATAEKLQRYGKTSEYEVLAFFCALLNRDALTRFGPLDDRFGSGLAADDEWCLRVRRYGWRTLVACGAYAAHMHRTTFERLQIDRDALQKESKQQLQLVLNEYPGGE